MSATVKVLVCVRCKGLWMHCSCVYGHALFYPLFALDRGWFQRSREVRPV